ncbi:hypothetical protein NUSPORA_02770 [Nucleospora cyclopteri]
MGTLEVENRIKTNVKIQCQQPDLFIHDKRKNLIIFIEIEIISQDNLQTVETEKLRKYDILTNELSIIYKCKVEIIPFVLTWGLKLQNIMVCTSRRFQSFQKYKHTFKL